MGDSIVKVIGKQNLIPKVKVSSLISLNKMRIVKKPKTTKKMTAIKIKNHWIDQHLDNSESWVNIIPGSCD